MLHAMARLGLDHDQHSEGVECFAAKVRNKLPSGHPSACCIVYCYMQYTHQDTHQPSLVRTLKELAFASYDSTSMEQLRLCIKAIRSIEEETGKRNTTPKSEADVLVHFSEKLGLSNDVTALAMDIAGVAYNEDEHHLYDTNAMAILCIVATFLGKRLDAEAAGKASHISSTTIKATIRQISPQVLQLASALAPTGTSTSDMALAAVIVPPTAPHTPGDMEDDGLLPPGSDLEPEHEARQGSKRRQDVMATQPDQDGAFKHRKLQGTEPADCAAPALVPSNSPAATTTAAAEAAPAGPPAQAQAQASPAYNAAAGAGGAQLVQAARPAFVCVGVDALPAVLVVVKDEQEWIVID